MPAADTLFRTYDVAGLRLPNRVVMAPMTRSRSPGGVPGPDVAAYYARRARAGVGLIITEGTVVERPGSGDDPNVPRFWGEAAMTGWAEVVSAVHAEGGRIMPQLWHVGATQGRRSQWAPDAQVESPSGLMSPDAPFGRAMSEGDIADTIGAFAAAARRAADLGFDGVEIHAAHGYLIDQFFWAGTNRRTDRYGGATLAERTRFATEIVQAIRREVGQALPISLRVSQWKQQDYAARLADGPREFAAMLEPLCDAGVDIIHCSQRRFWEPAFEGSDLNLAGWARRLTGRTAMTVGSVGLSGDFITGFGGGTSAPTSIDQLLERLARDEFDLVAVGRALLSDPHWLENIAEGRGDRLRAFDISKLDELH
ncbi:NADH:flavin oxidoreductase [Phenylobacterium sp.]|uniref:NADH:flavin oxidoreductase n=1 Tax=Phenylobacterium sp. TaxID=1871053 RepID=UPI0027351D97|nr:NADH:flavin oxidoreductase [Phenylobacterium sp.]MDP3852462.1 NADH:flavin oxidoreductase [Phenylobacterium sp.]